MFQNKTTSKQLMEVLQEAQDKISTLEKTAAIMKINLDNRLSVIRNIQEYEQEQMQSLISLVDEGMWIENKNKIVLARADIVQGVYDRFGSTIHPRFLKTPSDVFNFKTVSGYYYKDNATVTINNSVLPKFKAMLQHDSITGQDICFEEYDTPYLNISVKINPGELLGSTEFNVLEIVPYIPGSFDITNLEVYSLQGYHTGDITPDSIMPGTVHNIGVSRILIDRSINLYELKLGVTLKFRNSNGKYPFGIKHLYFLNASFNTNSYIVLRVREKDYLDTISEEVTITDQTGIVDSTCREERMELFIDWIDGMGVDSIVTSKGLTNNPIVRNTRSFYVHYPILRSTMAVQFKDIRFR